MATYLIDTCVWRDFFENRFSITGNPLSTYAYAMFNNILKNENKIIFSENLIWELKKQYDEEDINDMLNILFLNKILIKVAITKDDYIQAKLLANQRNLSFGDCLNAVHARKYGIVIITQDKHFFENLSDIAKAIRPQYVF